MKWKFRSVGIDEWRVSSLPDVRRNRLLNGSDPDLLLERLISEAEVAAQTGRVATSLSGCEDNPGYFRIEAQIPLSESTFDEFFNGRSGYRAQHYLSAEEGVLYNRATIDRLGPIVQRVYACDADRDQPLRRPAAAMVRDEYLRRGRMNARQCRVCDAAFEIAADADGFFPSRCARCIE